MTEPTTGATPGRRAVMREALSTSVVRRALAVYLLFNVTEWAAWITLLVWAFASGGVVAASVIALLQLVPASLLAAPVTRLLSRLGPGRVLCLGYALQAFGSLATATAIWLDLPFAVVATTAAFTAISVTTTRPAHNTLLPAVSATTAQLTAANTASGTVEAAAAFVGPLVAAALITPWGPSGVLLVLGVGMLLAALLTRRLPRVGAAAAAEIAGAGPGVRDVLRDPTGRALVSLNTAEYILIGMLDILLVALAIDVLGMDESGPGVLNSAVGLGGILGAGLTVLLVGRARLAPALLVGTVVAGIPLALTGASELVVVACLFLALGGAGKVFVDVTSRTLIQRALPDRMLVAVFGVQESTMMGGLAIGSLVAPLLVAFIGIHWSFVAAGVVLPIVTFACIRALRRADTAAAVPADVYDLLRRIPFLAVLPPRVVERLSIEARRTAVPAGTSVITQGDAGDTFYAIADGRTRVLSSGRQVRTQDSGDWFGELALLRDAPRSATVTAITALTVIELDRAPFLLAVTGNPNAAAGAAEHARSYVD